MRLQRELPPAASGGAGFTAQERWRAAGHSRSRRGAQQAAAAASGLWAPLSPRSTGRSCPAGCARSAPSHLSLLKGQARTLNHSCKSPDAVVLILGHVMPGVHTLEKAGMACCSYCCACKVHTGAAAPSMLGSCSTPSAHQRRPQQRRRAAGGLPGRAWWSESVLWECCAVDACGRGAAAGRGSADGPLLGDGGTAYTVVQDAWRLLPSRRLGCVRSCCCRRYCQWRRQQAVGAGRAAGAPLAHPSIVLTFQLALLL